MIVSTPSGRQLLIEDDNAYTSDGRQVAKLEGAVAFDHSGRYFGTLTENQFVFDNEDCLKTGSMFVPNTHVGFVPEGNGESSGREPRIS